MIKAADSSSLNKFVSDHIDMFKYISIFFKKIKESNTVTNLCSQIPEMDFLFQCVLHFW